jgi:hypothetical protein
MRPMQASTTRAAKQSTASATWLRGLLRRTPLVCPPHGGIVSGALLLGVSKRGSGAIGNEPARGLTEGRARAVARGVRLGRPRKLTPAQACEALARIRVGARQDEVARSFNVSASTISRLPEDVLAELDAEGRSARERLMPERGRNHLISDKTVCGTSTASFARVRAT